MTKNFPHKEDGFTLVDILIAQIIIAILFGAAALAMIHFSPPSIDKTFKDFEQWSLIHPYEAHQMSTSTVTYNDFARAIHGEDAGDKAGRVTYIPKDNGQYEFCLSSDITSYRYSSETQESVKDKTCDFR